MFDEKFEKKKIKNKEIKNALEFLKISNEEYKKDRLIVEKKYNELLSKLEKKNFDSEKELEIFNLQLQSIYNLLNNLPESRKDKYFVSFAKDESIKLSENNSNDNLNNIEKKTTIFFKKNLFVFFILLFLIFLISLLFWSLRKKEKNGGEKEEF